MEGKKVAESALKTVNLMMPANSNPSWRDGALELGSVHGGDILRQIDQIAGIVALRHCRTRVVTASIDRMDFLNPVHVGELLWLSASVNYTGTKSMEVGVKVETENLISGELTQTGTAYLTFVAVDESGLPMAVLPVIPETDEEQRRYNAAKHRKEVRLRHRKSV